MRVHDVRSARDVDAPGEANVDAPNEAMKLRDTIFRTVVVLLQGSGFATNFAAIALLTLFFEEVRRGVQTLDMHRATRRRPQAERVARLRLIVCGVLIGFSALVILA